MYGGDVHGNCNVKSEKLVRYGYKILHTGDLNENGNFIEDTLVMHHEMHGYKKCMGGS